MPRYHRLAELAPRDVVARAIDREMKRRGDPHVWLDITHVPAARVRRRFPNIDAQLRALGIDIDARPRAGRAGRALHVRRRAGDARRPHRTWTGSSPSARSRAPGCTARTASRATRCSRRWSARTTPRPRSGRASRQRRARAARAALAGPRHPAAAREGRVRPQLGHGAPRDVGPGRHRAHGRAAGVRGAAAGDAARGDRARLRTAAPVARPGRAAQHRAGRRPDRGVRAAAAREPGAALQPRPPAARSASGARQCTRLRRPADLRAPLVPGERARL